MNRSERREEPAHEDSPPTHRHVPQGRRRSVDSTTMRRLPSARKRPGSGDIPAPGPGRPREARTGGPLSFLRRTPREVYRVYDADEFLAGIESGTDSMAAAPAAGGRRGGRAAGAALLAGAVGAVGALIALNVQRPAPAASPGRAGWRASGSRGDGTSPAIAFVAGARGSSPRAAPAATPRRHGPQRRAVRRRTATAAAPRPRRARRGSVAEHGLRSAPAGVRPEPVIERRAPGSQPGRAAEFGFER